MDFSQHLQYSLTLQTHHYIYLGSDYQWCASNSFPCTLLVLGHSVLLRCTSNSTAHCLFLCWQDIVALPHRISWEPLNTMSLACDGLTSFVLIWLYLSFEMTLHWSPVSSLNAVFCLLS